MVRVGCAFGTVDRKYNPPTTRRARTMTMMRRDIDIPLG
jgi:hypothetical protein